MELVIDELDDYYTNEQFEKIPENSVPDFSQKSFPKKVVQFAEANKPMHQAIPKVNAKMTRPNMPNPKPQISYKDILSKMGMFVSEGKLHLVDRNSLPPEQQEQYSQKQQYSRKQQQEQQEQPDLIHQNSYIYNKYFANQTQHSNVRQPKTVEEYKQMLVHDYIQRQRIKQVKSTKLIMPTSNINMSAGNSGNLNKLFSFSKR